LGLWRACGSGTAGYRSKPFKISIGAAKFPPTEKNSKANDAEMTEIWKIEKYPRSA
jgi:hypothetical protein